MKYYTRIVQNEILVEVQIAVDPHPFAGYIAARKLKYGQTNELMPPATVWVSVSFSRDNSLDEIDDLQRWLSEATKMARLLDDYVTVPADFEGGVLYEVRQVAGTLILDKREV